MAAIATDSFSLPPSIWTWLLEHARRVAGGLRVERALTSVDRLMLEAAEQFGATILRTGSVTDLRARLYEMAGDARLFAWEAEASAEFGGLDLADAGATLEADFARALGESSLVQECGRLLRARVDAFLEARAALGTLVDEAPTPGEVLSDFRTPDTIRAILEEVLAGEVAMIALVASMVDPSRWRCEPWQRLALLEQIRISSLSHLRLLASVPGVNVSQETISFGQRLDIHALEREFRDKERFVVPVELRVHASYIDRLLGSLNESSDIPEGVAKLFADE